MLVNYQAIHSQAVTDLLKASLYSISWGKNAVQTVLWVDQTEVVALGSLWLNPIHPHREYVGIFVDPAYRRQGIGTQIFNQLKNISAKKAFQAAISSKDATAVSFLKSCNFRLGHKCFTPVLKDIISTNFQKPFYSFQSLSAKQQSAVLALQLSNYQATHAAINALNPAISLDDWRNLILDGLSQKHSFVLLQDEQIAAYILVYHSTDELEIGYVGGQSADLINDYLPFYHTVLNRSLNHFQSFSLEADDVDPFAFALLETYPFDPDDSWDTYLFK